MEWECQYKHQLLARGGFLKKAGEEESKDQIDLIDNKDAGIPRTARSSSIVGFDSPKSAVSQEVVNSFANTTGDG